MDTQVDKGHYRFDRYVGKDRWASYYAQIKEVLACSPKSVLEVGCGDGMLGSYLKERTGIQYRTLDIAKDLNPDIVGSVEEIPLSDASVDCVVAFEVLEHLPFDCFSKALAEMARVSKKDVIISLPHFGPPVKILLKLPFLPELRFSWKFPFPRAHHFTGEHYWELGKKGYSVARARRVISERFVIIREYVPFENQYHHFFILKKR